MTALRPTPARADAALAARHLSAAPMPGSEEPILRPERDASEAGASTPTLVAFIIGALIPQVAILLLWALAG